MVYEVGFVDNMLGMFVHWGIYSQTEYQEQYRGRMGVSRGEYRKLMPTFNPIKYNPDEWVELAYQAGMKYICFTAKHHDGFCMWDTKYTDFNIMNTAYGKDVLAMLVNACERRNLLFSLYYSIPDWDHPNANNPLSTHQIQLEKGDESDSVKYREYIKNQITELLTNYGKIYTLFWDIPPRIYDPSINQIVRKLQPGIIINDRGYDQGDFSTPERCVPDGERFEGLVEACQAVGQQSWGYRKNEDYYTTTFLMRSINKVMAMGGSYLLNVGPMPNGIIDSMSVDIIRRIGQWYVKVRESLENSEASTIRIQDFPNGNRFIATEKGGFTYLHFYEGLISSGVSLVPIKELPQYVTVLNTNQLIKCEVTTMPAEWDDKTLKAVDPYLHLFNLPAEELVREPMIVKIKW